MTTVSLSDNLKILLPIYQRAAEVTPAEKAAAKKAATKIQEFAKEYLVKLKNLSNKNRN